MHRKFGVLLLFALTAVLSAGAQANVPATTAQVAPISSGAGAPTGVLACNTASTNLIYVNTSTLALSYCNGSAWVTPVSTASSLSVTTITASATPAITSANGLQTITLSANATPTISGIATGQRITFQICQPASGGPYTWTWPASVHGGMTIGTTASTCSMQSFDSFTGTTLVPESTGVVNIAP